MAWFSGKKKSKKKPPILEPVGTPAVQAAPVAQPVLEPTQNVQGVPSVQAAPVAQPVGIQELPVEQQPIVEIAPLGVTADANVMVSTETSNDINPQAPTSTGWSKKSVKPLFDIHKKLDHMMDSKGKSLEERYKNRFGDKLPESVAADSARKEYNEKKAIEEDKPKIIFKQRSQLNLKPKVSKPAKVEKKVSQETKTTSKKGFGSKIGSGIKSGGTKTKAAFSRAGSAVGRGAGAVKSGIGRGTSKVFGLFRKDKSKVTEKKTKKEDVYSKMKLPELKAELKKRGLPISGNKSTLIKRLENN